MIKGKKLKYENFWAQTAALKIESEALENLVFLKTKMQLLSLGVNTP